MRARARWLVCLTCLGCHSVPSAPPVSAPSPAQEIDQPSSQEAPTTKAHPLSAAAALLAQGNDEQACAHLSEFVAQQPNHPNARYFLAELLFQRRQFAEARTHFEQTIAHCQEEQPIDLRHLLHCHGRLLSAAEALDDEYETQLQRGMSLVLLAQARADLGDPSGDLPVEALLCRAAGFLAGAHALRPNEARPCWYLHVVWRQLGQLQSAERWCNETLAAASFSYLAPAEQRGLMLANRCK